MLTVPDMKETRLLGLFFFFFSPSSSASHAPIQLKFMAKFSRKKNLAVLLLSFCTCCMEEGDIYIYIYTCTYMCV